MIFFVTEPGSEESFASGAILLGPPTGPGCLASREGVLTDGSFLVVGEWLADLECDGDFVGGSVLATLLRSSFFAPEPTADEQPVAPFSKHVLRRCLAAVLSTIPAKGRSGLLLENRP